MAEHPIENLMITAMTSLRDMIDVNTIVGDVVTSNDGTIIIPISKVSFGFASGGSEFNTNKINKFTEENKLPFGGGSGAGVNISPSAFIVVKNDNVRVINMNSSNSMDKMLDLAPEMIDKISKAARDVTNCCKKKEETKITKIYDNCNE